MVDIAFMAQKKVIRFSVEGKVVKYYDDLWKEGLQIMPSQTPEMRLLLKKMLVHRKPAVRTQGALIVDANSGKNKEEYESCKTDEEVVEIIRREGKMKGLLEVKA